MGASGQPEATRGSLGLSPGTASAWNGSTCLLCLLPGPEALGWAAAASWGLDETRSRPLQRTVSLPLALSGDSACMSFLLPPLFPVEGTLESVCQATVWDDPAPALRKGPDSYVCMTCPRPREALSGTGVDPSSNGTH